MDQSQTSPVVKTQPQASINRRKHKNQKHVVQDPVLIYVPEGPMPLAAQVRSFLNQVLLKPEVQSNLIYTILRDLEPTLVTVFGRHEPYIFGSMTTGLCLIGSDMDIFVDIGVYNKSLRSPYTDLELKTVVERCARALRRNDRFSRIVPIPQARVPIVKFLHNRTNMAGDISFKNPMGVQNSHLLKYYLSLHPRFFEVMVIIKFWAKEHNICTFEHISSYGWTVLFIAYLQSVILPNGYPLVPSVYELQRYWPADPRTTVNDWRVDFRAVINRVVLPNEQQYSQLGLLEGFFTYYSNFAFEENIVCPFLGQPIPWASLRDSFANQFPAQFQSFRNHFREFFADKVHVRPQLSIQDPFQHDFLIGLSCYGKRFEKVTAYIAAAARACRKEQKRHDPENSTFLQDFFALQVVSPIGKFNVTLPQINGKKWLDVVDLGISTLEDIFREIMKFTITSQSKTSLSCGETSSKVSKTGEAQNVHQCVGEGKFQKTYKCVTFQPVWNSRKKLRKNIQLCFPETAFDFERKLSEEVIKQKYPEENAEFLCTVTLPKSAQYLSLSFEERFDLKSNNVSNLIFNFLSVNLPGWLKTFMTERCNRPTVESGSKGAEKLPASGEGDSMKETTTSEHAENSQESDLQKTSISK